MKLTFQETVAAGLAFALLASIVLLTASGDDVPEAIIGAFTLAAGYILGSRTSTPTN